MFPFQLQDGRGFGMLGESHMAKMSEVGVSGVSGNGLFLTHYTPGHSR